MSAPEQSPINQAEAPPALRAPRRFAARVVLGRLLSIATVGVALASVLVLFAPPDREGVPRAAARANPPAGGTTHVAASATAPAAKLPLATVTLARQATGIGVPRSFLGISTEYWALPFFERHMRLLERALALVHVHDGGPLVLRIGGDSADHAFWYPAARTVPWWVFRLDPAWLRRTGVLVRRHDVRLILDLNLVTASPLTAAGWAEAAERSLPRGSIVGFEIGNEPDIYSRLYWLASIKRTRLGAPFLPTQLSTSGYQHDFRSYAQLLSRVAPGVPLIGPAVANPAINVNWIASLIAATHPGLGVVSAHRYPFSACVSRRFATFPTIARVLSERASAGMAQALRPAVLLAHRAGYPLRLTELNSVTCGGRAGVSDTFATALWAPDALFELLRAGVDGVNVHVRAFAINAAFTLTTHGLGARPLLYGLIMFARTLGPGARLVNLPLQAKRAAHLKVWGVRLRGDRLHVLLINKGSQAERVVLRLPATAPATVQRLLAPSVRSRSGVTLDGQQLTPGGHWTNPRAVELITPQRRGYELTVPPTSAALVAVNLRPHAGR